METECFLMPIWTYNMVKFGIPLQRLAEDTIIPSFKET